MPMVNGVLKFKNMFRRGSQLQLFLTSDCQVHFLVAALARLVDSRTVLSSVVKCNGNCL
jgi:hypothetical protein